MAQRYGIAAAGNWIIDQVKIVDRYPEEEHLAIILEESMGTGGAAYNTLMGLRALDPDLILQAVGVVGEDPNGERIFAHLKQVDISTTLMRKTTEAPTSYTDVMTVKQTGRRTFYHNRGANALLCGEDIEFDQIHARMFHLGYLMLLDALDAPDPANENRPCAARVLEEAQAEGIKTSLDMVTDLSPRLHAIVAPVLPHIDYFIANELEAAALTHIPLRGPKNELLRDKLPDVARELFRMGVASLVCIHMPEGGYWLDASGAGLFKPSLNVPQDFIKGTAGAGDAFCAGLLYGLHENWNADRCLTLAVAHAAQSLSDATTTAGLKSMADTMALVERFGFRS